jgi:acyl phosphate:glycerol-3-phosphate acyltransferase
MTIILAILSGYLLGSIPTSVWVAKSFYNIDIREHGSKNAGATNTFRVLGKAAGSFVFAVDVIKGVLPVLFVTWIADSSDSESFAIYSILAGVSAVVGHVLPLYAGFKGGKGVATSFGVLIALAPLSATICLFIFLLVWFAFNYVSLGSIIAALFFPLIQYFLYPNQPTAIFIFSIVMSILVIYAHKKNLSRLKNGIETKTYPFRRIDKSSQAPLED